MLFTANYLTKQVRFKVEILTLLSEEATGFHSPSYSIRKSLGVSLKKVIKLTVAYHLQEQLQH